MTVDWISFGLGVLVGFFLGVLSLAYYNHRETKSEDILAWTIACTWLVWNLAVGIGMTAVNPPTMYDIVSGGAVGFILGEKFFSALGGFIKK